MRYFGRFMLLTLGLGVVAFVLSSLPSHPVVAAAEGPAVTVVNTPLPVNVGNFPSTQAVSGTVNFGNFPSSLGVSNMSGAPLYVREVDNAAHHPFAAGLSTGLTCTVAPGSGVCNASLSVPSGEELVIETVSIDAFLSPGFKAIGIIAVTTGGTGMACTLPLTFVDTISGFDQWIVTQPLRLYADPGSTVGVSISQNVTGAGGTNQFEISGYTIACGAGTGCPIP
jgi:hypothetical protein